MWNKVFYAMETLWLFVHSILAITNQYTFTGTFILQREFFIYETGSDIERYRLCNVFGDFPCSPVVKTPCASNSGGVRSIPGWGTKIPHASWCGQKIKLKKPQNYEMCFW